MLHFAESRTDSIASKYLGKLAQVLELVPTRELSEALELLLAVRAFGRRVYVIGNGGSAATASHIACDLVKTAQVPGCAPLRVFGLTDNTPLVTAWANDRAYQQVFAEQITALVEPGDVVMAISASGNSPNIVAGLEAASALGAHTIALVGFDGGKARDLADIVIHIPSHDYGLVEDTHSAIGHALTAGVRSALLSEAGLLAAGA